MQAPLAVGGNRLTWSEVAPEVRHALETALGASVVDAASQPGGFSPGMASRLRLADGRRVFAKAVSSARNRHAPDMYRREVSVLSGLPADVPAPRLLWSYDDGSWVALVTEDVDGHPPAQPWRPDELGRFLDAAADLARRLTPSPLPVDPIARYLADDFASWRALAADPVRADRLDPQARADRLDPWAKANLDRLAAIESRWVAAAEGDTLLHCDLRADNVLLTGDGVVFVDWPHACTGAAWVDPVLSIPSIAMHGGGPPEEIWARYPLSGRVDPDAVTAVLTAAAGYFTYVGMLPPPPNLPTVRAFQRAQGHAAMAWLRERLR